MEQDIYQEMARLENQHWWFVARRSYLQKLMMQYFSSDLKHRFCEIGCGTGGNLQMLAQLGSVDAVELNEPARKLAESKKIHNINGIYSGHLPDAIPLTGKYDGVFSLDVIEHVENDLEAVKSLKKLLNEDGILIVTVPAYQWLWSTHDEVNHHFRRYTRNSFSQLLKTAGFEIKYSSYFNSILFPLAVLKRTAEYILPKKSVQDSWDIKMPPLWLNSLLKALFNVESLWSGKLTIPFGLSIVIVAKLNQK